MSSAYSFSADNVETLEQQLKLSLRPVKPNQEFVSHLQTRLRTTSTTTIERRHSVGLSLLLVSFSLLSGILVILVMRQFRGQPA